MSTFSGLGTALSSLIAQRQALEVSGQNIANANTVGYTRQRANLSSIPSQSVASMFSTTNGIGSGTRVTGIERLGDAFLDAQVRSETATSSYLATRSAAYDRLEVTLGEPKTTGLSAQLSEMWSAWHDAGNTPESEASRQVVLQEANTVVARIGDLYEGVATQWEQLHVKASTQVQEVNVAAAGVADLNVRILSIQNAGGTANELIDQRDLLVTALADLVGAKARNRDDGTVEVLVGGSPLVSGPHANKLVLTGAKTFDDAAGTSSIPGVPVGVVWASNPTLRVGLDGGQIGGALSVLAPTSQDGSGGPLTEAAKSINDLAVQLATQVNALHVTGVDLDGSPGGEFFHIDTTMPAARGLSVAVTDPRAIASGKAGDGGYDGSIATTIGSLGTSKTGPDIAWNATVVDLGVRTSSATRRADIAEAARSSAEGRQLANASVDTDEEAINMLAFQRAYEGAARVMTAIDEMLDTLINRTGIVGR